MANEKVHFDVEPILQQTTSTCWLACFQMLFEYKPGKQRGDVWKLLDENETYGPSPGPREMQPRYANPYQMYYDGIGRDDLIPAAKALGLQWASGGSVSIETLAATMKKYGPIWVVGGWNTSNHVVLLTGADPTSDIPKITLIDPWPTGGGERTEPLSWFTKGRKQWAGVNGSVMYW